MRSMILYMRTSSPLDALFPRTRQGILAVVLGHQNRSWYLASLAKHLGVRPSSLQREVSALVEAGVLRRRKDGNRVYFEPDEDCPFLPELRGLILKTAGLVDVLREAFKPLQDRILWAFVYGSVARGEEESASDVDLMVIGDVGLADVAPLVRGAQDKLAREVNVSVHTRGDFAKKLRSGYRFPREVLDKPKLFIVGNEHDLAGAFERKTHRSDAHQQGGARRPPRGG
jgi:predicted nucleotidyltransferase